MIPTNVMSFMKKMVQSENAGTNAGGESGNYNAQDMAGSSSTTSSTFGKIRQTLSSSLLTAAHDKDAELDRIVKLFDHLKETTDYPDPFHVCLKSLVGNFKCHDPNTIYLLLCLKVKLLKMNRLTATATATATTDKISEEIFQYYLWNDEIDGQLKVSYAAILKELFDLKLYDFDCYRVICLKEIEPKHYEIFKYLLCIRESNFRDVPLDDWERNVWNEAVTAKNAELVLLSFDVNRFRFINVDCIESMFLELLWSKDSLIAKKSNYLFKKVIEASILDTDLMHLCLLNESLDERQSHLINANLRLLPKLKNLHLKWNICLIRKFLNLELSSIMVLVEFFKYFCENFNQEELCELFREGNLFNVFNANPQLFQKPEIIELLSNIVQELHFDSMFSFNNFEKTFLNSIKLVENWNPICFMALFLIFFQYKRISKFHNLMINMIADISIVTIRDFCYQFIVDNCNFCYSDIHNAKSIAQLCFDSLKKSKNVDYTLEFLKYQAKRLDTSISLKVFSYLLDLIEAEYPDTDLKKYMFEINLPGLFFDYVERITDVRLGDLCPTGQSAHFSYYLKVFVLFFKDYLIEKKLYYKFEPVLQTETIDECNNERIDRYKLILATDEFDVNEFVNDGLFLRVYLDHFVRYEVDNVTTQIDYFVRMMLHLNESKFEKRIETVLLLMSRFHGKHVYAIMYPAKLKCLNHFLRMIETSFKSKCFTEIAIRYFESLPNQYFENATVHRNLLRILQLLFIYFKSITNKEVIYQFCFRQLLKNKHFDSINYFLYAIISQYPYEDLPDALLDEPKHFIMLAYFASRLNRQAFKTNYFIKTVKFITYPKFNIRSMAISLLAIYFKTEQTANVNASEELLQKVVTKAVKDYAVEVDKFFECFDHSQLYSLDNIFYHVPRLFGMSEVDCIRIELVTEQCDAIQFIQVQNMNNKFSNLPAKLKTTQATIQDESPFDQLVAFNLTSLVQRKSEMRSIRRLDGNLNEGLIVVASLIDASANLGGLCRTCQIFGAKQLVLANKKVIGQNQIFKSLSMTAENWIDIDEVQIKDLCDFLRTKKSQNFRIVGVEQTSNSRKLNGFKFVKNTVLVLGNEKHGILPIVLNVLDDCVEIPQVGIIPSLNVHVAASICIWEYFKQLSSN